MFNKRCSSCPCFVEKVTEVSGDAGQSQYLEAMKIFKEYGTKLIKGDISIEELKIITSNTNKFCQILSAIKSLSASQARSTEDMLVEAISKRTEEEKFINNQRAMVHELHTYLVEYSGGKICKYEHTYLDISGEAVTLLIVLSLIKCELGLVCSDTAWQLRYFFCTVGSVDYSCGLARFITCSACGLGIVLQSSLQGLLADLDSSPRILI